jgi:8-oxo-dGTP pyrophosphatase MutT (NUDIX family)
VLSLARIEDALGARRARRVVDDPALRAAVALILRHGIADIELLFIQRALRPADPWSGQMAFPGGRAARGDPDLVVTAERETREEVGLDLARDGAWLGALPELPAVAQGRVLPFTIAPQVFRLCAARELVLSDEVQEALWIPLKRLSASQHRSEIEIEHGGRILRGPCLRIDGRTIWGLTHRMLEAFLALGADPTTRPGAGEGGTL